MVTHVSSRAMPASVPVQRGRMGVPATQGLAADLVRELRNALCWALGMLHAGNAESVQHLAGYDKERTFAYAAFKQQPATQPPTLSVMLSCK